MVAVSTNNVIVLLLPILLCASFVTSEEVTKKDKEFQSRLISAKEHANNRVVDTTIEADDYAITIIETNMNREYRESAISSLKHNCQIYKESSKILWYTNEEMNDKHPYYQWLGAVNYEFVMVPDISPYMIVNVRNSDIIMYGTVRC